MKNNMTITYDGMIAENGIIIKDGRSVLRYTTRKDNTILTEDNGYECGCTYHIIMKTGHKLPGHPFNSLIGLLKYVSVHKESLL